MPSTRIKGVTLLENTRPALGLVQAPYLVRTPKRAVAEMVMGEGGGAMQETSSAPTARTSYPSLRLQLRRKTLRRLLC